MAFNSDEFDGESAEGAAIAAACNTMPFASPVRLVYVRNVDKLKKVDAEELVSYLGTPSATTVLACEAEKLAKNTRLYKALAAVGPKAVIDCAPPKSWELPKRVRAMACTHGITLSEGAASALVELVGENTVHLDNELKKIALAHGAGRRGGGARGARARCPYFRGEAVGFHSRLRRAKPRKVSRPQIQDGEHLAPCAHSSVHHAAARAHGGPVHGPSRQPARSRQGPRRADWRVKNHGAWARQWRPEELRRALASSRDAEQAMKSGSDPDEVFYRWLVETLKR